MDIPNILQDIVKVKQTEVELLKTSLPFYTVEKMASKQSPALNFSGSLLGASVRIIAEIKKRSPAKGDLRADLNVADMAEIYADNGAAAISVLTNSTHFGGSIDDLKIVCSVAHQRGIPVLRKEFIFDPYQVVEARANGADAVLLIAAMLNLKEMRLLKELADQFWMQAIFEVHDEDELSKVLECGAEIIGINNRNLRTFVTDIKVTEYLAPKIPKGKIIVSESGIVDKNDLNRIADAGAHCALIGETLVTSNDPGLTLRQLV